MRQTVDKLAETGWLYNKVRKYADSRSTDRAFGLVGQVWDAQLIWWLCNSSMFSMCQLFCCTKIIIENKYRHDVTLTVTVSEFLRSAPRRDGRVFTTVGSIRCTGWYN